MRTFGQKYPLATALATRPARLTMPIRTNASMLAVAELRERSVAGVWFSRRVGSGFCRWHETLGLMTRRAQDRSSEPVPAVSKDSGRDGAGGHWNCW